MVVMTEHNRIVFRELQKYMIENGVVPTQKELAQKMYFTAPTMQYHYTELIKPSVKPLALAMGI